MADDAGMASGSAAAAHTAHGIDGDHEQAVPPIHNMSRKSTYSKSAYDFNVSDLGGAATPMTFNTHRNSRIMPDLDEYFVGPRDLEKHSKLPYFMRMHGSVLPRMIVPVACVGAWATLITCLDRFHIQQFSVSNVLLTVLGFVVGLALSFRSSSAYERYSDGRKTWSQVSVQCRNLARQIWVHIDERYDPNNPQVAKDDLLAKVTALNMLLAFTVSLKHRLRFEPFAHYPDIQSLVGHLDTFAKGAHHEDNLINKKKTPWKVAGEYLGLSVANSNPRKELKRADRPLGNLPLEILTYLSAYIEETSNNGTLKSPVVYGQILSGIALLTDCQSSAERVLNTPLPAGYNILISQIVLLYVYILPFQLIGDLGWLTIPGTIAGAYIIVGLAAIGNELENPFGNDVNDLPLDQYCAELAKELDVMTSVKAPVFSDFLNGAEARNNAVLWPLSESGYGEWRQRSEADIRSALRAKVVVAKPGQVRSRTPSMKKLSKESASV